MINGKEDKSSKGSYLDSDEDSLNDVDEELTKLYTGM